VFFDVGGAFDVCLCRFFFWTSPIPVILRRAPSRLLPELEAAAVLPPAKAGMPKLPPSGQDGLSAKPDAGEKAQGTWSSASFTAMTGRRGRVALFLGYFLLLETKSTPAIRAKTKGNEPKEPNTPAPPSAHPQGFSNPTFCCAP